CRRVQKTPAVEFSYNPKISLNTPPGTKVKLSGIVDVKNGFLLLNDSNTTILGGEVEHLFEKWELQRSLSKRNRSNIGTEGGPPPFVPFGQKCREEMSLCVCVCVCVYVYTHTHSLFCDHC
uniref:RecQ mediated genome instability protein 1 OB-fold domain-containing protein n=1 Tax=Spermophilus dauricus TaxID=99837 RepID=A0A8C9P7F2_SPEDA